MSGTHDQGYENGPPDAHVRSRRSFPVVWIIPIVALAIAAFLGWRALYDRGPLITITFLTGDGLTAGQTRVQHKAVDLCVVGIITKKKDMKHVEKRVRV